MLKKRLLIIAAALAVLVAAAVFVPDIIVVGSAKNRIITDDEAAELENTDCVLVLGAGVRNGSPTPMLRDRLITGISLYKSGAAPKIIMSGDHGREDYDEVNVMKSYAVENGVPDSDVFMDHAGFSTYDSIYRAKAVFEADSIIIVTQKYHLYRALYIADKLGVNAVGVAADLDDYSGQLKRDLREIAARDKDFFSCLFKPEPKYLGEKIPVSGDGNITDG